MSKQNIASYNLQLTKVKKGLFETAGQERAAMEENHDEVSHWDPPRPW